MKNNKPNLFIAGVAKAGTTVLANYLDLHPEVCMAAEKEPDFFTSREILNSKLYYKTKPVEHEKEYLNLFSDCEIVKYRGEASVSYFNYLGIAKRIKEFSPESKVIILLRNPVERAFSHYLMDKRLGFVTVGFDQIIAQPKKYPVYFQQYIEQGKYAQSIEEFKKAFAENILFLAGSRDLELSIPQICAFLNIEDFSLESVEGNRSQVPKNGILRKLYANEKVRKISRSILNPDLVHKIKQSKVFQDQNEKIGVPQKEFLENYYLSDIQKSSELLGENLFDKFKAK